MRKGYCASKALLSYFKNGENSCYPYKNVTIMDMYDYVKGDLAKRRTMELRKMGDADLRRNFKWKNFDFCTFSGTFSSRKKDNLIAHSGFVCFDFDEVSDPEELKRRLIDDRYVETELAFVSPSGRGLKWVVGFDPDVSPHGDFFDAIGNYVKETYGAEIDRSGRDVCRCCFLPHDPMAYIRPELRDVKHVKLKNL